MSEKKSVLITGGATGIGKACVLEFLQANYNVAFCDINEQAALLLVKEAQESGLVKDNNLIFTLCDTTKKDEIKAWVTDIFAKFKRIDALFANAGIHRSNTLMNISDDELELMININIYGTIYTLQEVVPYMQKQGGGAIVLNNSDQWYIGKKNNFAYGLTKGALGQITRSLALDLAQDNIRVCSVCPGTIKTPLAQDAIERYAQRANLTVDEAWQEEASSFPLNRVGSAYEVAQMVFFLIDKATFSTGAHYLVDGGLVAGLVFYILFHILYISAGEFKACI